MGATPKKSSILIVDDEEGIRHGLSQFFSKQGLIVHAAEDEEAALAIAAGKSLDIAILDIRLKNGKSGLDLLAKLHCNDPDLPIVMVTGYGSIDTAIQAIKHGAADYILKPIENLVLLDVVVRNLELARLRKDNTFLRNELLSTIYQHDIITSDPKFLSMVERADRIKDSEATILITGESGTGKEVLARYVHFTSKRRDGPFVGINCAAISETLLLSELFGHEKGAFTGATERHIGKFELADKGTLFLDEIGDMSLSVQSKLLRVLEENAFERVGGVKRIAVDIRVVAATNRDLGAMMKTGEFRSDLYYRIAIMELTLPPLRERKQDIPLLIDHFLRCYTEKYRKQIQGVTHEIALFWSSYDWPGNVRELQNAVNQAVLLCKGNYIDTDAIGFPGCADVVVSKGEFQVDEYTSLVEMTTAVVGYYEKMKIERCLEAGEWNQSQAARELGITRKTLASKMKRYGIVVPQ